jgi:hypothetical protein
VPSKIYIDKNKVVRKVKMSAKLRPLTEIANEIEGSRASLRKGLEGVKISSEDICNKELAEASDKHLKRYGFTPYESKTDKPGNTKTFSEIVAEVLKDPIFKCGGIVPPGDCDRISAKLTSENLFTTEKVNSPLHYNIGKIEVADFIADQKMDFFEGNIIKYVSRHKYKEGIEDLKKAEWYLTKLIKNLTDSNKDMEKNISETTTKE